MFSMLKKGILLYAAIPFLLSVQLSNVLFAKGHVSLCVSPKVPLTILFTNDMHSNCDYSRLATLIKEERLKAEKAGSAVIVVDAGDMAMGSVFQTLYSEHAFEYVAMALMGYDAITCGNHDFDFGYGAFADMLSAAKKSKYISVGENYGLTLPHYVISNLDAVEPPFFKDLGIKDTVIIHKTVGATGGEKKVSVGIYGLMGDHAYSCITDKKSLILSDRMKAAEKAVEALQSKGTDYIILLSHSGTLWAKGKKVSAGCDGYFKLKTYTEDGKLASGISRTDAILSGHDHELLEEPLSIGKSVIGSSGSRGNFLGKIVLVADSLAEYTMIPIADSIRQDETLKNYMDEGFSLVSDKFQNLCNLPLDDTIAVLEKGLPAVVDAKGEMELGFYIAESYRQAAMHMADNPIGIAPFGVIRNGLEKGAITNGDIFDVLSLGMCPDGTPGYPLVILWLTGDELYDVCELNASVAWGHEDVRLFISGMEFQYNRYRIPFTRVTEVSVDGMPVEKDKLYPMVTGMYTAKLMGLLESSSFGLLSVIPKDKLGNPLDDIESSLVQIDGENGASRPISEWMAFAEYTKKTKLKNPAVKSSVDNSTLLIFLQYAAVLGLVAALIVLLLRFGKRVRCRQP